MGNVVAQLALLVWLPLSLWIGSVLSAQRAATFILVGAALFLPERVGYDFPVLPELDKHTIASLSALAACAVNHSRTAFPKRKSSTLGWLVMLGMVGFVITAVTNPDSLHYGPLVLPGLGAYDVAGNFVAFLLRFALPYYLGLTLFRSPDDLRILLRGLVVGALVYVPLVLFESRMSPQLHVWVYGFFQHDFIQSVRAGGFRAFVFMSHGLAVAFFMSQALTTTVGLARARDALLPFSARAIAILLAIALVSCKSMGAFLYAGATLLLTWFAKPQTQLRVASWLAILVVAYPLARFHGWIPMDDILEKVATISEERASSLRFRFDQEGALLERALLRPYFGWGSWGRNRIYDQFGRDVSVPDGEWVMALGTGGMFWFLVSFGFLLIPVLQAKKAVVKAKLGSEDSQVLATTAMLLAFTGLDLIPNSMSHPLPLVLAGALSSTCAELFAGQKLRGRAAAANAPSSGGHRGALTRGAT